MYKRHKQSWTPPSQHWIKYNTDASKNRMNNNTTISYVYRNTAGRIITKYGSITGDMPILVAKVLAIREALKHAIQGENFRVTIQSDSLITIQVINRNTLSPLLFLIQWKTLKI